MAKMVLGIIVGFLVWSVLWVGSEPVIAAVAPDMAPDESLSNVTSGYLILKVVLSVLFSVVAGYLSAVVADENSRTPLILAFLLLLVGIGIQASIWDRLPVWYHLTFLVLLVPLTVAGGKMRKTRSS
jgi:Na+-driven multidrug efflux pump